MRSPEKEKWKKAMDHEMDSIKSTGTSVIKPMPACLGKLPVKNRWVYTKKYDKDGNVKRYKARLVAKGDTQVHGIDYFETFVPVAKFKSIRTLAAIGAKLKLTAFQDDVPTAFLRGSLQEEVWMDQPQGYETGEAKEKCLLKKTLYGLKQSPREWNAVIHKYLLWLIHACISKDSRVSLFLWEFMSTIQLPSGKKMLLRSSVKISEKISTLLKVEF